MFLRFPKFVSKFSNDSFRTFLTFWSFQAPLHLDRFFDLRTLRSFGALCTRPRYQRSPTGCSEADAQTGSARCTVARWDLVTMKTCEVLLVDYWGLYFQYLSILPNVLEMNGDYRHPFWESLWTSHYSALTTNRLTIQPVHLSSLWHCAEKMLLSMCLRLCLL